MLKQYLTKEQENEGLQLVEASLSYQNAQKKYREASEELKRAADQLEQQSQKFRDLFPKEEQEPDMPIVLQSCGRTSVLSFGEQYGDPIKIRLAREGCPKSIGTEGVALKTAGAGGKPIIRKKNEKDSAKRPKAKT